MWGGQPQSEPWEGAVTRPPHRAAFSELAISGILGGMRTKVSKACMCAALTLALVAGAVSPSAAGWGYRSYYGFGHHYGFGRYYGYGSHFYGYGHGGTGAAVLFGLGLLTILMSQPRTRTYDRYYRYPTTIYRQPRTVYVQPTVRQVRAPVQRPAPRVVPRPTRAALPPGCLMIREYTTTVMVDGRERDAYGDKCLLADGSWRKGPPKLVPE